ncbi:hypothetical protein AAZV13_05G075900 [Glycine max]
MAKSPHSPGTTMQLSGVHSTTELIAHRASLPPRLTMPKARETPSLSFLFPPPSMSPPCGDMDGACYNFTPVTNPVFGIPLLPPTNALHPIIPNNACILCLTTTAGTKLADAYSLDTIIGSSPGKAVHDPSLGQVSVLVWLIILSDQLLTIAMVLTCYSPFRNWKHDFPFDLHILTCITYSFLVCRQS